MIFQTRKLWLMSETGKKWEVNARTNGQLGILDAIGHHRIMHIPTGGILLTQCYQTELRANKAFEEVAGLRDWDFIKFPVNLEAALLFEKLINIAIKIGACQVHLPKEMARISKDASTSRGAFQ